MDDNIYIYRKENGEKAIFMYSLREVKLELKSRHSSCDAEDRKKKTESIEKEKRAPESELVLNNLIMSVVHPKLIGCYVKTENNFKTTNLFERLKKMQRLEREH